MTVLIANAPCSWGVDYADDPANPPWPRVMDEIAAAGFRRCELGPLGYFPAEPGALGRELAARGLALVGGFLFERLHDPREHAAVRDKARRLLALVAPLDARVLVLIDHVTPERGRTAGRPEAAVRLEPGAFAAMLGLARDLGRLARDEFGVAAVLHHHAASHVEFGDEIARAMDGVPEDILGLCVDTGHAAYAGLDPAALVRTYGPRVRHLHLKDVDPAVRARAVAEGLEFDQTVALGLFTPLGQGCVDFAAFRDALRTAGFDGAATIEQDVDPAAGTAAPLADARASRGFLEGLGFRA